MSCSVYWLLSISPSCISGTVWDVAIHASFTVAVWDVAMMVSPACNQFSRALRVLGIYSNAVIDFGLESTMCVCTGLCPDVGYAKLTDALRLHGQ